MLLSNVSPEVLATISQRLDGVYIINLLRCGNVALTLLLKRSRLDILFEANHVGFLSIPNVLKSINDYLPRAESLVLLDTHHLGRMPVKISCDSMDLDKMDGLCINVREFAYVGRGASVDAVTRCLMYSSNNIDSLFPTLERWFTGSYSTRYVPKRLDVDWTDNDPARDVVYNIVPKSAHTLALGLGFEVPDDSVRELENIAQAFAENPLHSLSSTSLLIEKNMFEWPAFQHLVKLDVICCTSFATTILPRSLTTFSLSDDMCRTPRRYQKRYVITLLDAPPNLEKLCVHGQCVLEMKESLPAGLEEISATVIVDPGHFFSATTLPKKLRKASVLNVLMDFAQPEKEIPVGVHMFRNVLDELWASKWPDALEFDMNLLIFDEASFDTITKHVRQGARDFAGCAYTWNLMMFFTDTEDLAHADTDLQQKYFLDYVLASKEVKLRISAQTAVTPHSILRTIMNRTYPRKFNTSTTELSLKPDPGNQIQWTNLQDMLAHIHEICISLSVLDMDLRTKDGSTNMCALVIPSWCRTLVLNQLPGAPLQFASSEKLECLKITIPLTWQVVTHPVTLDVSASSKLPSVFLVLPPKLVTLDLQTSASPGYADFISLNMDAFFDCLPKTILYLHIRQTGSGYYRTIKSPHLQDVVAQLPPHLRLFDWTAYHMDVDKVVTFSRKVANVPSLFRLVMSYRLETYTVNPIKSGHCLHMAKWSTSAEQQALLPRPLPEQILPSDAMSESPHHSTRSTCGRLAACICLFVMLIALVRATLK